MTLVELKNLITAGTVPSEFIILVSKDNQFLARQYVKAICDLAQNDVNKISSIYEPFQSSLALLTNNEGCLNILITDVFDERSEDYTQFENTIVVCEQIDKSIAKATENYAIKLPKLEEWQILDYAKVLCPTVEEADLLWLIKATNGNIECISNELAKVSLFDKKDQKQVFYSVCSDAQAYLNKIDFYAVVDALVHGNKVALFDFVKRDALYELDPVGLANSVFINLKNIIIASQNRMLSAEDCGMTAKQHGYITRNYFNVDIEAIKLKLKFLAKFDLALKTSQLDMSKETMMNYLIANLSYKITK